MEGREGGKVETIPDELQLSAYSFCQETQENARHCPFQMRTAELPEHIINPTSLVDSLALSFKIIKICSHKPQTNILNRIQNNNKNEVTTQWRDEKVYTALHIHSSLEK